MKELLCKVVGHKQYDPKVLALRPWEMSDFRHYPMSAFREHTCLRCQSELIEG